MRNRCPGCNRWYCLCEGTGRLTDEQIEELLDVALGGDEGRQA